MNFTLQDVESMITTQRSFYFTGETRSVAFRKKMLLKLKDAIIANEEAIMEALHKDLRKSPFESYVTEIGFVLSSISHMIKHLEEWMEQETVKTPIHLQPAKSFIIREPYGSVLIIGPFNYPFQLVMEPLVGAIAGGNCAIVKPSETSVHTAQIVKKLLSKIYPSEYIRVVEGEREETSALIHASFDKIFFTGSVAIGKVVMKAAAERLTPITLELGGKSPALVDQTADLRKAAERIVWGKFVNAGQTCVAPDYVLVHHSVKEELLNEMIRTIHKFYGKEATDGPDYGRIVNGKHFDRLVGILKNERVQILYGGNFDRSDLYIEPTLLDNVSWDGAAMENEIFGPILPILSYGNLGEAVHQIRQLPKPLSAYMFTENEQAADYFIEQLPFGGGCINDTIAHVGNVNLPFGGVGPSGMNAYHGRDSFNVFTHTKAMMKKSTKIPMKLAFPPYGNKLKIVKPLIH
ncbi:aldehyde dehydrogenase [Sporosarcina limicola]|uniref:Aldehyde dehydrogenase n=1 Tax=Sporosarcina limicola TaxID=34101 RepID=A0A927MMI5_9BACL|nr:aldehyde dehydrogenase [Sporosarcina limicola]MBE1557065.1 aldehyde dehydrogenase (NAD+) [Sporosarcina limicola]